MGDGYRILGGRQHPGGDQRLRSLLQVFLNVVVCATLVVGSLSRGRVADPLDRIQGGPALLERWHARSIVPTNLAAVSRVQDHVLSRLDNGRAIVLEIRFDDRSVSARDLAAYLALLDGAFGRTDPSGFRSYSLRARDHLSIDRFQTGSTILELLLAKLGNIDPWRFILVYLVVRTGPSILRGEAAKNLAEAAKTLGEAALVWSDVRARVFSSRTRARLRRRQRSAIRSIIQADPLFEGLSRPDVDVLVRLVEEVLVAERNHLPAAARFDAHVLEVAVRIQRRRPGGDEM